MKELHNIHNHKIKTVEGYWVLPGQTIYVDDEGKKCKKPEEKIDLSEYAKKSDTPNIDLSKYVTKEDLDKAISSSSVKLNFDAATNTLYVEE